MGNNSVTHSISEAGLVDDARNLGVDIYIEKKPGITLRWLEGRGLYQLRIEPDDKSGSINLFMLESQIIELSDAIKRGQEGKEDVAEDYALKTIMGAVGNGLVP